MGGKKGVVRGANDWVEGVSSEHRRMGSGELTI